MGSREVQWHQRRWGNRPVGERLLADQCRSDEWWTSIGSQHGRWGLLTGHNGLCIHLYSFGQQSCQGLGVYNRLECISHTTWWHSSGLEATDQGCGHPMVVTEMNGGYCPGRQLLVGVGTWTAMNAPGSIWAVILTWCTAGMESGTTSMPNSPRRPWGRPLDLEPPANGYTGLDLQATFAGQDQAILAWHSVEAGVCVWGGVWGVCLGWEAEANCCFNLTAVRFSWDLVVFPGGGKDGAARHNPGRGESGG